MYWKNWKTINNNSNYKTESENPILKKDEHHAEIIDITDGLVVDEKTFINIDYEWDNESLRIWSDLYYNNETIGSSIWDAFGNKKI